jgi:hypothetical protein
VAVSEASGSGPEVILLGFDFLVGGTKIEKYLRAALRGLPKNSNRLISGNVGALQPLDALVELPQAPLT